MTILSKFTEAVTSWNCSHSKTWSFVAQSGSSESLEDGSDSSRRLAEWLPKMCDVRIQLEETDEMIPSVKFALATHSDVFAAMFYGSGEFKRTMDETLDGVEIVRVAHCSAEGIRVLNAYVLRFFKEASITASNIGDVLCVADKYAVEGLRQCCDRFIKDAAKRNDGDEMVEVLASLNRFNLKDAIEQPLAAFDFAKVFTAPKASKLLPEWILRRILASDELALAEKQVFVAAEKWCHAQSELLADARIAAETAEIDEDIDENVDKNNDDTIVDAIDDVKEEEEVKEKDIADDNSAIGLLSALLPLIRLPLMDMAFFSQRVCELSALLTSDQKLDVMRSATSIRLGCEFPNSSRNKQPFAFRNTNVYWASGYQRRFTKDMGLLETVYKSGSSYIFPANVLWPTDTHSWTVQLNRDDVDVDVGVDVLDKESGKTLSLGPKMYRITRCGSIHKHITEPEGIDKKLHDTAICFGVRNALTVTLNCDKSTLVFDNGRASKKMTLDKGAFYRPTIAIRKGEAIADFTVTYLD